MTDQLCFIETIPNDVPWYTLMGVFVAMGALLAFGVHSTVNRWVKEGWVPPKAGLWGDIIATVTITIIGWVLGCRSWDPLYGAVSTMIGAWCSPWFMLWVNQLIEMRLQRKSK